MSWDYPLEDVIVMRKEEGNSQFEVKKSTLKNSQKK